MVIITVDRSMKYLAAVVAQRAMVTGVTFALETALNFTASVTPPDGWSIIRKDKSKTGFPPCVGG